MTDTAFGDAAGSLATRKHANEWGLFLALVSCVTLAPFAAAPLVSHVIPQDSSALYVYAALVFLGANFHVASTGWFYTDPEMRSHFRARPVRYIVVPCLLVSGSAATFYFVDRALLPYFVISFLCWQLWHYQKQNIGLLSFIAAGTDGAPLSIWERRTLALAAFAGILGLFSILQMGPPYLAAAFLRFHSVGMALYCLVPVAFCIAVVNNPALRANRIRLLFFLITALFFFPTFVFSDSTSALAGYAIAHGLQYLVFMGFVSASKGKTTVSLIKLLAIATFGGIILDRAADARDWLERPYELAIYGAFLGLVMTHFVLDAGIWRLRESFQRNYMRKAFYFVFDRG